MEPNNNYKTFGYENKSHRGRINIQVHNQNQPITELIDG